MRTLRKLFSASVSLNFRLTARHVRGVDNGLADALSRQDWPRFRSMLQAWRSANA